MQEKDLFLDARVGSVFRCKRSLYLQLQEKALPSDKREGSVFRCKRRLCLQMQHVSFIN